MAAAVCTMEGWLRRWWMVFSTIIIGIHSEYEKDEPVVEGIFQ